MGFLEVLVLRLLVWAGVPLILVILAVGPRRFTRSIRRFWDWLLQRRLSPEEVLTRIVRHQQAHVTALRRVVARLEEADAAITSNIGQSEKNIGTLREEASRLVARGDDLGGRAVLYKMNVEKLAVAGFQEQRESQRQHIIEARRRLYLLELQLRQFEVGRSILLSQLAEARTVEQQYAIASRFDPFNAIAEWERAEGMVQEKALSARAFEQVVEDTADISPGHVSAAQVDSAALDAQLSQLKAELANNPEFKLPNGKPRRFDP